MVSKCPIKVNPRKDRGGWAVYLPKKLVEDGLFALNPNDKLVAKIDGKKLVIEKV